MSLVARRLSLAVVVFSRRDAEKERRMEREGERPREPPPATAPRENGAILFLSRAETQRRREEIKSFDAKAAKKGQRRLTIASLRPFAWARPVRPWR